MPLFLWWEKRDREGTEEGKREEENGEKEGGAHSTNLCDAFPVNLPHECVYSLVHSERKRETHPQNCS